jgi:hypothetical protein
VGTIDGVELGSDDGIEVGNELGMSVVANKVGTELGSSDRPHSIQS